MMLRPARQLPSRRLIALAMLLLLLGGAILGLLRYQPLAQAGDLEPGQDMQAVTIEEFEEEGAHILRYDDEEYVTYAFTIRNTGPVGVTVTGIDLTGQEKKHMLQPVAAGLVSGDTVAAEDMLPLKPFALGAGSEQRIMVQARFDNCEYYTERAIEVHDTQAVTFRLAGVTRTAQTRFDRPLLVRSPSIQGCADRTLDRSQNRRTDP